MKKLLILSERVSCTAIAVRKRPTLHFGNLLRLLYGWIRYTLFQQLAQPYRDVPVECLYD